MPVLRREAADEFAISIRDCSDAQGLLKESMVQGGLRPDEQKVRG